MPLETNFNTSPYHDDYDQTKDYYRVLFRPGLPVQTRELNQLQTMLQKQIERFGDNIFKRGTVVDGCNFIFLNSYPYAKLVDNELDGSIVIPSLYVGLFAKNSANLQAYIVNYEDGFEASAPDLKTIYLNYINSGNTGNLTSFSPGDTLTIFDSNNSVFEVDVNNGGLGFSNSDTVVFTPAIAVNVSSGAFTNGEYVTQSSGANLQIIEVDETSLERQNQVLLKLRPRATDLANGQANSSAWTIVASEEIRNISNTVVGQVENIFGSGAEAIVTTSGAGRVIEVTVSQRGRGYEYEPHATIRSPNNSSGIASLDLTARNYLARMKISADQDSVGNGYAFGVSDGIIYQKGYFLRVGTQYVIVSKYSQTPNNVTVGFKTLEEIVDFNADISLLDNATGEPSETAPGANRLRLTPELTVLTVDDAKADDEFFSLVEWNDGNPYKQNQVTAYSRIGDEMATRAFDESGNFVIDTFQVQTESIANTAREGTHYTVVVDPGRAYIGGFRVVTNRNYRIDVPKALTTETRTDTKISLNYGNYIRIKDVGGLFQFSTGDVVALYNSAKGFLSNATLVSTGNTTPVGTKIGEARMRSLVLENGIAGTASAVYRLYLFDIRMEPGRNFRDVRSVYYNGTYKGIADLVLDQDPTTAANIAVLLGQKNDQLVFSTGVESVKNTSNTTYQYRTIDQTTEFSNSGILVKSIASTPGEFYPYVGTLSDAQLRELYVVPMGNNLIAESALTGTVDANDSTANIVGTSTAFVNDLEPGDWIYLASNATHWDVRKVVAITNNTFMSVDANVSFSNSAALVKRIFPKNVPIPFGSREGLTANVDANGNILTLSLGFTLQGTVSVNTAIGVNIERRNVTSTSKTANRKQFVKIRLSNNAGGTDGPWCLGVSDVFRLRNVYVGSNSSVDTSSPNLTREFFIDHNQTANYLDLSYLYRSQRSKISLSSDQWLLVEFDYFTRSGAGYFDTVSYLGTANAEQIAALDATPLANLASAAASWEVPEVYTSKGKYFDLINHVDFRPAVANTAAPATNVASAPVNPVEAISFGNTADPSNDKKFPVPDSILETDIEHYLGRIDNVFIAEDGKIYVLQGTPAADPRMRFEPNHPKDALKLQVLSVPPYPNLPVVLNDQTGEIIATGVSNEKYLDIRHKAHRVTPLLSHPEIQITQPMVYTMEDIGNLERRIKDLEYYVSLSLLETNITNKVIPSSIDRTLNRFKFGFFADDFSTYTHTDWENPQYAAEIEEAGDLDYGPLGDPTSQSTTDKDTTNPIDSIIPGASKINKRKTNRVVPPKYVWMLKHIGTKLSGCYIDHLIIEQSNATETPNPCIPSAQTVPVGNVIITNSYYFTQQEGSGTGNAYSSYTETRKITFANAAAPATLYFYNYTKFDKIEVFQGNTLVIDTSDSVGWSNTDKTFLSTNNDVKHHWGIRSYYGQYGVWFDYPLVIGGTNNDYTKYGGKLVWNHNPANGREYTIKTHKGSGSYLWRWMLQYPKSSTQPVEIIDPCGPVTPTIYKGTMKIDLKSQWSCSKQFVTKALAADHILIWCTGLKPSTEHKFFIDGTEEELLVKQIGKAFGEPLVTDEKGKLELAYHVTDVWLNKIKAEGITFKNRYWFGSSGYTLFEVKAPNSSASALVANRAPTKLGGFKFGFF